MTFGCACCHQLPQLSEQPEAPEVKGQAGRKPKGGKKIPKVKTEAEQKLDNRSSGTALIAAAAAGQAGRAKQEPQDGLRGQPARRLRQEGSAAQPLTSAASRARSPGVCALSVAPQTLLSMFRADGAVESIRFRSLVREDPAVSRRVAAIKRQAHPSARSINAYVVFKEPCDSSPSAILSPRRNGAEIEKDFIIRVDRVSSKHDHKRSIFVGNLNFELKELALRRHFEQCGVVEAVRLVRDHNTGLGKGFGYVLFESCDSVQLALKLDGSKVEGRAIRVRRSAEKEARRGVPAHGVQVGRARKVVGVQQAVARGRKHHAERQREQRQHPRRAAGAAHAAARHLRGDWRHAFARGAPWWRKRSKRLRHQSRVETPETGETRSPAALSVCVCCCDICVQTASVLNCPSLAFHMI
uniref:RNA binding motif protein 34 n=1 Tax=Hippocampus comes TaxID=109280 RepID=A0A3Q2YWQ8_HIPCM